MDDHHLHYIKKFLEKNPDPKKPTHVCTTEVGRESDY
jgi:hypothetical protein